MKNLVLLSDETKELTVGSLPISGTCFVYDGKVVGETDTDTKRRTIVLLGKEKDKNIGTIKAKLLQIKESVFDIYLPEDFEFSTEIELVTVKVKIPELLCFMGYKWANIIIADKERKMFLGQGIEGCLVEGIEIEAIKIHGVGESFYLPSFKTIEQISANLRHLPFRLTRGKTSERQSYFSMHDKPKSWIENN